MVIGAGAELGYKSWVGVGEETAFGTAATCSTFIEFNNESMKQTIEEVLLPSISGQRTYQKRALGNVSVEGSIEYPLSPVDGVILFHSALGGTVTSSGTATTGYTHTLVPGDIDKSLTVKVQRGSTTKFEYKGCKVESMVIRGNVGEPIMASVNFKGASEASATAATPSYSMVLPYMFKGAYYQEAASVGLLTTTAASPVLQHITSFELSIKNNLIDDSSARALGTNTVMMIPETQRDVELTVEQRFDTTTSFDKFVAGTPAAIRILLTHPTTAGSGGGGLTYSMQFTMPTCYYNGSEPNVSDKGVLTHTLPLRCIADSLTGYDIQAVIVNATASY